MDVVLSVVVGLVGAATIVLTVLSAAQTLVVPGPVPVMITRRVFVVMRAGFYAVLSRVRSYRTRDHVMASYAPISLLALPAVWTVLVLAGFAAVHWSLGVVPWREALFLSGSSLMTLGFHPPPDLPTAMVALVEAGLSLGLVALLMSYLPCIYGHYSKREEPIISLEVHAGTPPWGLALLERQVRSGRAGQLDPFWHEWGRWFVEVEESHMCTPSLVFFRSSHPHRSWVTAAGSVLDAAALAAATRDVDGTPQPSAEECVSTGCLALRRIGDYFFVMPYEPDPQPGDPITVSREEFGDACRCLVEAELRSSPTWTGHGGSSPRCASPTKPSCCSSHRCAWHHRHPGPLTAPFIPFHRIPITRRRARSRLWPS
jgi:hypothetical protein